MSTSTVPARTRSLRKPANRSKDEDVERPRGISNSSGRTSRSPSRLPTVTTRKSTNPSTRLPSNVTLGNASLQPAEARANIGRQNLSGPDPDTNRADSSSDPVKQDRSRPPISSSRHLRNVSTGTLQSSARSISHIRNTSSSSLIKPKSLHLTSTSIDGEARTRPLQTEQKRPAFSALQQHFSPAKSLVPKPHLAAFLAPPSPSKLPANIAISAETAKLQIELLQLHLLHRDAAHVEREWKDSAKRKLSAKFESVVEQNDLLYQLEIQQMEETNASALKQWDEMGTSGLGLENQVHVLSEVLTGVWSLGDSGGKYQKLVSRFEKWLVKCEGLQDRRAGGGSLEDDDFEFLTELDDNWKQDFLKVRRRVEGWLDHIRDLGTPAEDSSVATIVNGCRDMVRNMLDELTTMAQLQQDALLSEKEWIRDMIDESMTDADDTPVAGAAWRLHGP